MNQKKNPPTIEVGDEDVPIDRLYGPWLVRMENGPIEIKDVAGSVMANLDDGRVVVMLARRSDGAWEPEVREEDAASFRRLAVVMTLLDHEPDLERVVSLFRRALVMRIENALRIDDRVMFPEEAP